MCDGWPAGPAPSGMLSRCSRTGEHDDAFRRAFEKAGVVFLEPGDIRDGGEGMRLKKPERRADGRSATGGPSILPK